MSFMDFFSRFTGGFGGASSVDLAIDLGHREHACCYNRRGRCA